MPKDPVCGRDVDINTKWKLMYKNKAYHFCSEQCMREFGKKLSGKKEKKRDFHGTIIAIIRSLKFPC
ncbi:MAG TPA: YHS domain-containing protein [Candidatus Korarchaeota archaeon]|nr:YHS domain-containing protein [Candidatus Korarchaeota archaeon]